MKQILKSIGRALSEIDVITKDLLTGALRIAELPAFVAYLLTKGR